MLGRCKVGKGASVRKSSKIEMLKYNSLGSVHALFKIKWIWCIYIYCSMSRKLENKHTKEKLSETSANVDRNIMWNC